MELLLGFEIGTGAEVKIDLHHTVITGMTGVGKTSLIKRIVNQIPRVILFDVKNDYVEFPTYPPRVTTKLADSLTLKEILEVYGNMSLRGEFPELIKVTNDASDIMDVTRNIDKLLKDPRIHPVRKDKLLVIKDLLQRFLFDISPLLALKRSSDADQMKIDISTLSEPIQQYIVNSEISSLKNSYTIVIDEAHKFIPEKSTSIAKRAIINLLREGRSKGNFVILSDQTITGISKEALKQCWNWILGRQLEINEIKRAVNQVVGIRTSPEEIASLRVGEFIYFSHDEKIRFYSWAPFIDKEKARERAIELGNKLASRGTKNENIGKTSSRTLIDFLDSKDKLLSIFKNHNSKDLAEKLEKMIEMLSEVLREIRGEYNVKPLDPKDLILELIRENPGVNLTELSQIAKNKMRLTDKAIARALRELIDEKSIEIRTYMGEIKFYPTDDDYYMDIDLT